VNARTPPPPPAASRVDVHAYTRQSRTYEPDDPDLRKKRVRKFRLEELQRVPREHRDLYRALQHLLPEALFERGLLTSVRQTINQITQIDLDLWLHSIRVVKRTEMRAMIPGATFLGVVGLAPLTEKLLLEIDLRFVYRAIDRLLGGHGVAVDIQRPLTEIEQGVFSYLLLKVLLLFQGQITAPDQIALRLDDMRNDLKSAADIVRHDDFWICVALKMNFDLDVGYCRVLIPAGLAKRISPGRPPPGTALFDRWNARIRERMGRLNGATVDAVIDIGRIELTREDLANLDPGDIILLENTQARLEGDAVAGTATMTLGLGRKGLIYGNLAAQNSQLVFEVSQIEISETPEPHDPQEAHGEHGNPEEVIAEYEDGGAEQDDGSDALEDLDEDYGLDDENEGDDEEFEEYQGEEGQEEQYAEGGEDQAQGEEVPIDDDDNLAEAGPLLGDIPINVVVELGRVQLTADEVIRLRAGQLLELGRSPSDPVDLVVNGKLLAKGELVEIEGALGVKILSLLKEGQ
jgi:type III secretion system YscQ/HrcQ family protein